MFCQERIIQDYTGCPKKVIAGDWAPDYSSILLVTFLGHPVYFSFATQVEQTPGRLLRHSGEQGDEVDRGKQTTKIGQFFKKGPWIITKASDCVNGTWLEDLGVTDYNTITKKYLQHRSTTMVPILFDCH